jgi:hypothetical protein
MRVAAQIGDWMQTTLMAPCGTPMAEDDECQKPWAVSVVDHRVKRSKSNLLRTA